MIPSHTVIMDPATNAAISYIMAIHTYKLQCIKVKECNVISVIHDTTNIVQQLTKGNLYSKGHTYHPTTHYAYVN